ncbi:MAG: hypothetical protein H0W12_01000 [Chitinophagaceae bacterium]|nr:hypothetical protein [Chitinophagaceae bacterium]
MKKILGIIVCTVLFFASTNAQVKMADNVNTRDHASHQANKTHKKALMKELNLSKQQKSQMKQMHKSMKPQKKAIMENASLSAEQKKEQLKQLRMGQRNKMSSILTPEQLAKWKADKEMGRRKGK